MKNQLVLLSILFLILSCNFQPIEKSKRLNISFWVKVIKTPNEKFPVGHVSLFYDKNNTPNNAPPLDFQTEKELTENGYVLASGQALDESWDLKKIYNKKHLPDFNQGFVRYSRL